MFSPRLRTSNVSTLLVGSVTAGPYQLPRKLQSNVIFVDIFCLFWMWFQLTLKLQVIVIVLFDFFTGLRDLACQCFVETTFFTAVQPFLCICLLVGRVGGMWYRQNMSLSTGIVGCFPHSSCTVYNANIERTRSMLYASVCCLQLWGTVIPVFVVNRSKKPSAADTICVVL